MMPKPPIPSSWRQRLLDALLLPLALLAIVLEDVLWRGARAILLRIAALPATIALRQWLGRLPAWAALPLFLVPELAARVGDLWFAVLLYQERLAAAVLEYALVRVLATLVAVFIWQSCSQALLSLRWLAWCIDWIAFARDWTQVYVRRLRGQLRWLERRGALSWTHRVQMLRAAVLRAWGRG